MYKGASQGLQAAHRVRTRRDEQSVKDYVFHQTDIERMRSLQLAIRARQILIEGIPKGPERRKLSAESYAWSQELGELKKKLKFVPKNGRTGLANLFVEVCKLEMPAAEFRRYMAKAFEKLKAETEILGSEITEDEEKMAQ